MPYTLVQHTGYTVGGNPQFKNAVEERSVSTKREERAIRRAGGRIFQSYGAARIAAASENRSTTGVFPRALGKFVTRKDFKEPIYIPWETVDEEDPTSL